jgi:hypothetical protein
VGLGGAEGLRDPRVCTAGSAFPIVQKIQHLPDVFLCYALHFCVHVVFHGAGHIQVDGADYDVGAGMSYANDSAVYYEIHGDYDVPSDHCGAFVHNMFQVDDVMYGDNVVDDVVESDYVVHGDSVVLGSVVQADYVVQPACVVHGDNMIGDDAIQPDYVVLDDEFAVQVGSVIPGDNVVLDDETVVQVGSVIHGDNVVQYDDIQYCWAVVTDAAVTSHSFAENDTGNFVMKHYYVLIDWNGVTVNGRFQLKT